MKAKARPAAAADERVARGSFSVRQGGITVASGSGPYDDIKREAAHYALIYGQDGLVKVTVRRSRGAAVKPKPRPNAQPDEHLWRRQHDTIERVANQIVDSAGDIGSPHQSIGLLASMERNGRITPEMRAAGERFHELFMIAAHQPLRAADMGRVGGCGSAPAYRGSQAAKDAVEDALKALGGRHSPAGCCAWLVLGCEYSLTRFASQEGWMGRPIQTHVASGVLIASLGLLQNHFGF